MILGVPHITTFEFSPLHFVEVQPPYDCHGADARTVMKFIGVVQNYKSVLADEDS